MIEDRVIAALEGVEGLVVRPGEPASRHTLTRLGGPIELWLCAETEDAAAEAARVAGERELRLRPWSDPPDIVLDGGLDGAWIALGEAARGLTREGRTVEVGAELGAAVLAAWAEEEGLGGLQALAGRAGSAASAWRAGLLEPTAVRALRGAGFSWVQRASERSLVVALRLELPALSEVGGYAAARRARRGGAEGLPGRLMTDDEQVSAAAAIAEAGLSGVRLREIRIGRREPNALVNLGGGRAGDARLLVRMIKDRVKKVSGVELELARRPAGRTG